MGEKVPETWWCVVEGVHFSLHLVVQDNRTLFQSVAQQILSHDDHSYPGTAHVLLSPSKNQPKLHGARRHLTVGRQPFFVRVCQEEQVCSYLTLAC